MNVASSSPVRPPHHLSTHRTACPHHREVNNLSRWGLRLFENLGSDLSQVEQVRVIETDWAGHPDTTYLVFRNMV
jgi:hypothetical protein